MRNVILFNLFIWLFILNCSDDEKKVNGGCYVENGVKLMSTVAAMNLTQAQRNLPLCYQFSGDKTVNKSNCIAMSGKEMDECPSVGKKHTCDGKEKGVKIVLYEGWPGCGTLEGKSDSSLFPPGAPEGFGPVCTRTSGHSSHGSTPYEGSRLVWDSLD